MMPTLFPNLQEIPAYALQPGDYLVEFHRHWIDFRAITTVQEYDEQVFYRNVELTIFNAPEPIEVRADQHQQLWVRDTVLIFPRSWED